jgi:hypothetical protein
MHYRERHNPFALVILTLLFLGLAPLPVLAQEDLRTCDTPYGTLAVVEPQDKALRQLRKYDLGSPGSLLRVMAQESNCFLVVERGEGMQNMQQERALAQSGELRGGENMGKGQMEAADFIMTPNVLISDPNSGGIGAAVGRRLSNRGGLGALGGGVKFKTAETSLLVSDSRSGIQVASATGKARKTDFSIGMLGIGSSTAIGGGGYTDTDEGKVIAASYLDNFNKVITSLQDNPNMNRYGAQGENTESAGEVFNAGDVVTAKIDNVKVLQAPESGAATVTTVSKAEPLVCLGTEENGYLQVQGSGGQGWINKVLVTKK